MQFKHGITPEHSSLPSTQEHLANFYQVPAVATQQPWSCREKGLPGAHTSLNSTPACLLPLQPALEAAQGRSGWQRQLLEAEPPGAHH